MERRYILSVLVHNHAGVLCRVASLFSRRGYNIHSLTVGETLDSRYSRMTIELYGDAYILEQIQKQLAKLVDVVKIVEVEQSNAVFRELMLVKVRSGTGSRAGIIELCSVFRANIVDLSTTTATIEMTDEPKKNNALLELLEEYGVIEIARTGIAGLQLGEKYLSLDGEREKT